MRSSLPIFIFVGLALLTVIGVVILGATATSAAVSINNTSKDDLAIGIYGTEFGIAFGIAALLFVVALYFALKTLI